MSHYFVAIMKYLNHLIATKCLLMHFALTVAVEFYLNELSDSVRNIGTYTSVRLI